MEGLHVLLFVEFSKDLNKTSMIVKTISKDLVDNGHHVTIVDTEAFEFASGNHCEVSCKNRICHHPSICAGLEVATAKECTVECDVMLFISPKIVPSLPKCINRLMRNVYSVILNRWCLQGVSCFVIRKKFKTIAVAQYIWKLLRKLELNGLHNALAPWKHESVGIDDVEETPLPSI